MGLWESFGFKKQNEVFASSYGDDDSPTHGPWNNWECDDPDCICHDAEEADTIGAPWQGLQNKEDRKKR